MRRADARAISRRTFCTTAAASLAVLLAGCSNPLSQLGGTQASVAESLAKKTAALSPKVTNTVEKNYLTVGIDPDSEGAPLFVEASGKAYGIDVDVAEALADELGLKVRFVKVSSDSAKLGSSCDVVMGASKGDVSGSSVVGNYVQTASAFFHNGSTGVAKVEDLSSKTVGVQAASVSQTALGKTGLTMTVKSYDDLNSAFAALTSGKVDYVLCDAYCGFYLQESYPEASFAGTLDAPVERGVAVSSDNAELSKALTSALTKIDGNGVMALIRKRWVNGQKNLDSSTQVQNVPAGTMDTADGTTASVGAGGLTTGSNAASI
ncbi:MAG: substrate-binding periplasmic protein [Parafannyhessea sp.]|uniref:substrate-binding periplasmic protein n=1 Tax=Parafannyhessea sp. TaxID=2847324 RepID=UPI003EFC53E5